MLGIIAMMMSSFAMAQSTTGTNWSIGTSASVSSTGGNVNALPYLDTAGDSRGIAVNTTNGNVYYTNYITTPPRVYVCNVLDGTTTGMGFGGQGYLDTTRFDSPTQQLSLDKVKVADDGVIYACNLIISTTTQVFRIYRWQNETSSAITSFSGLISTSTVGTRFDDALGVTGSGKNTQIYVGGSGDGGILVFTTSDGTTFSITNQIWLNPAEATNQSDIVPLGVNSTFWVTGSSRHTWLYNQSGLAIDSISGTVIALGGKGCVVGTTQNGKTYMIVCQSAGAPFTGTAANVVDISGGGTTAFTVFTGPASGQTNSNGNGTGGTAFNPFHNTFYQLYSNNILGSYTLPLSTSPTIIVTKPGNSGIQITAFGGTGVYTWSVSPGIGSLSTTAGLSVNYIPGVTSGMDTVTVTDSANNKAKVVVSITPTSTPIAPETVHEGIIRSEPVWTFME